MLCATPRRFLVKRDVTHDSMHASSTGGHLSFQCSLRYKVPTDAAFCQQQGYTHVPPLQPAPSFVFLTFPTATPICIAAPLARCATTQLFPRVHCRATSQQPCHSEMHSARPEADHIMACMAHVWPAQWLRRPPTAPGRYRYRATGFGGQRGHGRAARGAPAAEGEESAAVQAAVRARERGGACGDVPYERPPGKAGAHVCERAGPAAPFLGVRMHGAAVPFLHRCGPPARLAPP